MNDWLYSRTPKWWQKHSVPIIIVAIMIVSLIVISTGNAATLASSPQYRDNVVMSYSVTNHGDTIIRQTDAYNGVQFMPVTNAGYLVSTTKGIKVHLTKGEKVVRAFGTYGDGNGLNFLSHRWNGKGILPYRCHYGFSPFQASRQSLPLTSVWVAVLRQGRPVPPLIGIK